MAKKLVLPRIFSKIDVFLSIGDANEEYYRRYGVDDGRLVRGGFPIDIERYDEAYSTKDERGRDLRKSYDIPSDHVLLLMVGKLVPWKSQIDLIRTMNHLSAKGAKVTAMLVGSGPDERNLKNEVRKEGPGGVILAGFINPEELVNYYSAADIYVHTAEADAHPLAVCEAIYMGLPVIVTDRCGSYGPTDDLQPGRNGAVYRYGQFDRLVELVELLIEDAQLRMRMGSQSREIGVLQQKLAHGAGIEQALDLLRVNDR